MSSDSGIFRNDSSMVWSRIPPYWPERSSLVGRVGSCLSLSIESPCSSSSDESTTCERIVLRETYVRFMLLFDIVDRRE